VVELKVELTSGLCKGNGPCMKCQLEMIFYCLVKRKIMSLLEVRHC